MIQLGLGLAEPVCPCCAEREVEPPLPGMEVEPCPLCVIHSRCDDLDLLDKRTRRAASVEDDSSDNDPGEAGCDKIIDDPTNPGQKIRI